MHLGGGPIGDRGADGQLLQHACAAAGDVLLVLRGEVGRAHEAAGSGGVRTAFADADAPVHGPGEVPTVLGEREPAGRQDRPGSRPPKVLVDRARPDQHSRVEQVVGVEDRLDGREELQRGLAVHQRQHLAAGPAVTVLAGAGTTVRDDQPGGVEHEVPEHRRVALQREVQPDVHAAVTEMPVGDAGQPVTGDQGFELPQVRPQLLGRDGGVLPARPALASGRGVRGQPGAVLADPPDRRGGRAGRQHDRVDRRTVAHHGCGGKLGCRIGLAANLDHQPAAAARQVGHLGGALPVPDDVHQPGVEALHGERVVGQHGGDRVGGRRHVRVPEHHQQPGRADRHQPDGRLEGHREGALGADQRAGQVAAAFGEQMLERVARHLAGEPAELGPQHVEMARHQSFQPWQRRQPVGRPELPAGAVDDGERGDVVGGPAVGNGVRPAGVVADHPAERRPVLRRRIGTEAQPVRRGGALQVGQHHPGLHQRGTASGVEVEDPVHPAGEVQHDAGADRVAGDGRAAAAAGQWDPGVPADLERGEHVVDVRRRDDHQRQHPVVAGVAGVLGAPAGPVRDLTANHPTQAVDDVGRRGVIQGHAGHHCLRLRAGTGRPA